MKTVLFVPGHTENLKSRDYKSVIKAIENKGYKVRFVPINWRYTYVDKWVNELEKVYGGYKPEGTILAGFSYGAITAFMAASKRNPAELWLFSLSPYFAEDMSKIKDSWKKAIGRRKIDTLSKLLFANIAPKVHCRTLLFMGSKEAKDYPPSKSRVEEAKRLMKNSWLIYIDGVDHDVADKRYIEAIEANI